MTVPPPSPPAEVYEISEMSLCFCAPEMVWLKDPRCEITQEGVACVKFVEFSRTQLTLKCLDWILSGNYEAFVADQKEDVKLSYASFGQLQTTAYNLLRDLPLTEEEGKTLMQAALILGDIGKTPKARDLFPEIKAPDHDDFEKEAIALARQSPGRLPSFDALPIAAQGVLEASIGIAHFGHIHHLEGGKEMFESLKGVDPLHLEFALFIHACDVAGAAGHIVETSSIVYTQPTFDGYQAVAEICRYALKGDDPLRFAIEKRGALLGLQDELTIRLSAMLRIHSQEEAALVASLCSTESALIYPKLTPTYMPAVLLNLLKGKTREAQITNAITKGVPLLRQGLELGSFIKQRLCFNALACQVKSHLIDGTIQVDHQGNISLIE